MVQYDKRKGEGGRGKEKGEGGRGKRNIERERESNVTRRTHARTHAHTHAHTRTRPVLEIKINTANKLFYLMLSLSGSKLALLLGRCNFDRPGKGISFVSCFVVVYMFKCYYLQWRSAFGFKL